MENSPVKNFIPVLLTDIAGHRALVVRNLGGEGLVHHVKVEVVGKAVAAVMAAGAHPLPKSLSSV